MFPSLMTDLIGIACPPQDSVAMAKQHGFAGVDLRIAHQADAIEAYGIDRLSSDIRDAGLRPGYCSILPMKMAVDDATWAQAIADLPRLADIAQRLGYTRCATVVLPFHDTLGYDAAFDEHVQRIAQATPILRDHGIRLGLEYVSPLTRRAGKPHPFIHGMSDMLQLTDACGECVGIMLDTFHWHCAGETLADLTRLRPEQVVVVHMNDAITDRPTDEQVVTERELPGETGVIELVSFMTGLRQIGYDGPLTAEPTHPRWRATPPHLACQLTADALRRACASHPASSTS